MNPITSLLQTGKKHFGPGGKYQKYHPLYEALETVFWGLDSVTDEGPQVRDSLDTKRYMALVILALLPLLCFGIYNAGYQAHRAAGLSTSLPGVIGSGFLIVMPLVMVSYIVGFFWEVVFAVKRKHVMSEGVLVTAMLFPLTLPPTTPLWQAALGISFGVVIGKEIFGGTGRNFLNPALTGRAFLFFAYPASMSGDRVWTAVVQTKDAAVDMVTAATPLVVSAAAGISGGVEAALERSGYTFATLFWGRYPGSIGATSTLLCLVGAIFLMALGIANYRIIIGDILGVVSMGVILNFCATEASSPFLTLNPFYHLVMGGAAFGIAFMTTDPVSAPDLNLAKWIYGLAIGALTVLIRVFNPAFPEGIMLAILFMNVFAPLLDHLVLSLRLKKRVPNV